MSEILDFVQRHPLLVGAFIITLGLVIWTEIQRLTRDFGDISPQEAVQLINHDDPLILDIRENSEMTGGRINGAKHIPLSDFGRRASELDKFKDGKTLVYCRSGQRSISVCKQLKSRGFAEVANLKGGIVAWESANLPLAKK
jgi:rhodanese-related sulfurtransferase